jgi:hypothetical protein
MPLEIVATFHPGLIWPTTAVLRPRPCRSASPPLARFAAAIRNGNSTSTLAVRGIDREWQRSALSGSSSPGGAGRAPAKTASRGSDFQDGPRPEATPIVCDGFDGSSVPGHNLALAAGGACMLVPNERDPSEKTLQCGQQLTVHPAHGTSYRPLYRTGQQLPVRFEKCVEFTRPWRRRSGSGRANREARPAISLRAGARHQRAADSGGYRETPSH